MGVLQVSDKNHNNFYLMKWEGQMEIATETEDIELEGSAFTVNKEDWFTRESDLAESSMPKDGIH